MMATSETRVSGLVREEATLAIRSLELYRRSQDDRDHEAEAAWTKLDDAHANLLRAILTEPPQSAGDIAHQANVIRQLVTTEDPRGLEDLKDEVLVFADNVAAWAKRSAK